MSLYRDNITNWYVGLGHALDYSSEGGRGLLMQVHTINEGSRLVVHYGPEVLGLVIKGTLPDVVREQMIDAPLERFAHIDFNDPGLAPGAHVLRGAFIESVRTVEIHGPCTVIKCRDG